MTSSRAPWLVLFLVGCGDATAGLSSLEGGEASTQRGLSALDAVIVQAEFPAVLPCGGSGEARVRVRNTGTASWSAADGFKLGTGDDGDPLYRRDLRVFLGDGEVVPPRGETTFVIPLEAPATPGPQRTDWQMVQEYVQWFGQHLERTVQVECGGGGPTPPPAPPPPGGGVVELCAGVAVDTSAGAPATAALQACVDALEAGDVLELPPGTYLMDGQLRLFKPLTLRTAGTAGVGGSCLTNVSCAVLKAAPALYVHNGFVAIAGEGVVLDHVVLDGNRGARLQSQAAATCTGGLNRVGFNATAQTCARCQFLHSASINALCGTGFEWLGDEATVIGSTFRDNGDNARHMMWADGLTLLQSDGAVVRHNEFVDNSDIGLISGGARGGLFAHNLVRQARQLAFGGLMLDNFNGYTHGDFTGAELRDNVVECGGQQCDYGIVVGPHAWYPSANTRGGVVSGNTVTNAKLGLVVSGAGTSDAPVAIFGNALSGSPSSARFTCGVRPAGNYVIAPDSHVDTRGDPTPFQRFAVDACP